MVPTPWTYSRAVALSQGDGAPMGHWRCPDMFLVIPVQGGGATGIWQVEAQDAAQHPTLPRTASAIKNDRPQVPVVPGWGALLWWV